LLELGTLRLKEKVLPSAFEKTAGSANRHKRNFGEALNESAMWAHLPLQRGPKRDQAAFRPYGEAQSVKLINDRETGRPKGFAFVTIDDAAAASAIAELDGKQFGGRRLRVNEARERAERPPRSFDGPRGGGRPSFGGSQGGFQRRDFGGPRGGGLPDVSRRSHERRSSGLMAQLDRRFLETPLTIRSSRAFHVRTAPRARSRAGRRETGTARGSDLARLNALLK
jgi:hypothetical protein